MKGVWTKFSDENVLNKLFSSIINENIPIFELSWFIKLDIPVLKGSMLTTLPKNQSNKTISNKIILLVIDENMWFFDTHFQLYFEVLLRRFVGTSRFYFEVGHRSASWLVNSSLDNCLKNFSIFMHEGSSLLRAPLPEPGDDLGLRLLVTTT